MRRLLRLPSLFLLASAATARAQDAPPAAEPAPVPVIVGRIFMRDTLSRVDAGGAPWRNDPALASARAAVEYEPKDYVKFVLEIELAGANAEIRDAYLRLRPSCWLEAQAGRFKRPISAIDLESKWTLPILERGLLTDLLVGDVTLPLGGRTEGLQLSFTPFDLPADPTLRVALFRNRLPDAIDANLDAFDDFSEDLYARFEIEPVDSLAVSASAGTVPFLRTAGAADSLRQGLVGGIDVVLRTRPVDVWAEAFYGQSPLPFIPEEGRFVARGDFTGARVIAAPRFRRPFPWLHAIEPFTSLQLLDPSTRADDDRAAQATGGVNLYWSRDGRVQVALEHTWTEAAAPTATRTALATQIAAVF